MDKRIAPGLTDAEIAHFAEDGYVVIDHLFSADEVVALRQALSAPEDREWEQSDRLIHSLELTVRHPAFLDLARDPCIASRLVPLLGPDIQLQHSKLAAQPQQKRKGGFRWHQDFAFFPHTNSDLAAVMVMLDDATEDNGSMHIIRGSHKLGLLDHADENGLFSGGCTESHMWENPEKIAGVLRLPKSPRHPNHPFGHAWHQEGEFGAGVNRDGGLQWLAEE